MASFTSLDTAGSDISVTNKNWWIFWSLCLALTSPDSPAVLHLPKLSDGHLVSQQLLGQPPGPGVGVVPLTKERRVLRVLTNEMRVLRWEYWPKRAEYYLAWHEQLGAGDRGQQRLLLLPHQTRDGGVAGVPRDSGLELRTQMSIGSQNYL